HDDRLAQRWMRHAERGRFGDETGRVDHFLDLSWAHAIAGRLDHLAFATDEIKKTICVATHRVAGPNRDLGELDATQLSRHRTKPLRGFLDVVPISERDVGAAMHQLARFIGRARRAVRAHDEYFGV